MSSLTRSCCQTVHLMPNCFGSVAQAHRDHWEVLEIVVATLKFEVHPWPLKIGIRHRSLARPKCAVEDDLGSWELASQIVVSAMDFFPWMLVHVSKEVTCDENLVIFCALLVATVASAISVDAMDSLISFRSRPSF